MKGRCNFLVQILIVRLEGYSSMMSYLKAGSSGYDEPAYQHRHGDGEVRRPPPAPTHDRRRDEAAEQMRDAQH